MNHKTFGFGISEEEETIVSMCTVLLLVLVVFVAGASGNTATKSIWNDQRVPQQTPREPLTATNHTHLTAHRPTILADQKHMIDGWTEEAAIFNWKEYSRVFSTMSTHHIFSMMLISTDSSLSVYKQTGHAFTVNTLSVEAYQINRPEGLNAKMCSSSYLCLSEIKMDKMLRSLLAELQLKLYLL